MFLKVLLTLFQGVMEIGQGSWAEIKKWGRFERRTSVQLKDKWRTICNQKGRLQGKAYSLNLQPNTRVHFGTLDLSGSFSLFA